MDNKYIINIFPNREVKYSFDCIKCGSVYEDNATKLYFNLNFKEIEEINVSEFSTYMDIDTLTGDGKFVVPINNKEINLTTSITKYNKVKAQLVMEYNGENHIVFKSKTFDLYFYDSINALTPVSEDDIITLGSLSEDIMNINNSINNINISVSSNTENIENIEENLINYSLVTETGNQIELSINDRDFKMKAILKDKNGNVINESNIVDLPLEQLVMDIKFDEENKTIIITLENGQETTVPIGSLVSGLVSEDSFNTYKTQNDQSINDLDGRISNNSTNISDLYKSLGETNTNVNNNTTNITNLNTKVENIESSIGDVESILSTLTTLDNGGE